MKQLIRLALLSCALCLISCSSRQELDDATPTASGTASIAFDFTLSEPKISTARALDESQLTVTLNPIKNVRIVFYSEKNGKPSVVAYAFDKEDLRWGKQWTGRDLVQSSGNSANTFSITGVHDIAPDDYSVIFFTSPSDQLKELTSVGKDYGELGRPIEINLHTYDDNPDFVATRHSLTSNIEKPLRLTKEQLMTAVGSEPLKVGNILLKALDAMVNIRLSMTDEVQSKAGLWAHGLTRCYPDVLNRTVLLFPEWEKDDAQNLTIPKDDNYSGMTDWAEEKYKEAFAYNPRLVKRSFFACNLGDKSRSRNMSTIIMPENTTTPSELNTKNVSRIIFQAQVVPLELSKLPEFNAENADRTWFAHAGKSYLWSKFKSDYDVALKSFTKKGKDLSKVSATDARILKAGLAINKQLFKKDDAQIGDPLSKTDIPSGLQGDELSVYKDGNSYYALPIRHYSDDKVKSLDAIGRYGVVRNTRYLIEVKAYSKVGAPTYQDLPQDINFTAAEIPGFSLSIGDKDIVSSEVTF